MYDVITSFTTSSNGLIDITGIPTTYKNLRLLITSTITTQDLNPWTLRPNASTSTFAGWLFYYDAQNTGPSYTTHTTYPIIGGRWYDSRKLGCFTVDIFDYSQTDKYKVIRGHHMITTDTVTSGVNLQRIGNGMYRSNSAITRLYLPNTYLAGTQVMLLGIGVK